MIIDLDELKTYLGVTGTASDTILELLSELAIGEVEGYLDQNLESQTYTDEVLTWEFSTFDRGYEKDIDTYQSYGRLFLNNYPVTSFVNLKSADVVVDSDDYEINLATGVITSFSNFRFAVGDMTATYIAGYTSDTLPSALKGLIFEAVKQNYQFSGSTSQGVRDVESKKVGDYSVKYASGSVSESGVYMKSYIANNQNILNRYKRFDI